MFCGQCGKRVLETMLFCPFCGATIVIPDQEEEGEGTTIEALSETQPGPVPASEAEFSPMPERGGECRDDAANEPEAPVSFFDAAQEEVAAEEQSPGHERPAAVQDPRHAAYQRPAGEVCRHRDARGEEEASSSEARTDAEPRPEGEARRPVAPRPRQPVQVLRPDEPLPKRSYIPVRDVDVNDIFMDGTRPGNSDPYDADAGFGGDAFEDDAFDFEEPEDGGFFQRHIRGMVGLILLLMLLVIFLIWAALPNGQRTLATLNLAWSASAYNDLGHEAYDARQFEQAAAYFERALARDGDNYEYAHSAMVAYYDANEDDKSFAMLKRCIEMDPDSPEPYHELLILFPDPATRPWEASELVRLGYERTGDETLNLSGE